MPAQLKDLLSGLHIPQLGCVIHGASGHEDAMGVKLETDDLHLVAHQVMQLDSILTVPNLGHLVKGARHNLVAIEIIRWLATNAYPKTPL